MLIVLDNASDVEQVRPLLPGSGSCGVVVTSRDALAGMVARDGARRIELDLLPAADAHALLRLLIGPRVDAEPDAAATLADLCARLPLALRVAAELAVSRPTTSLAQLAVELADRRERLDLLDAGGDPRAAVAAVFSWSVQHLPPQAASTFGLLGLHPGPDLDAYAAAALAGCGLQPARRTVELLARAHLVHPTTPGRYGMHDLLRAYATSLVADARTALGRLFDYYLATAAVAVDGWYPIQAHPQPPVAAPTTPVPALAEPDPARAWLDTERPGLVAVAAYTASHGWPTHTAELSRVLHRYLDNGNYLDALAIHGHAQHAAVQAGDLARQAHALRYLGTVHGRLGRFGVAGKHFRQALALFHEAGDQPGEARALAGLGIVEERLGRHASAIGHHERALALYRQVGDQAGEALTLNNLGVAHGRMGRGPAADHFRRAVAIYQQLGDPRGEAYALDNLGKVEEQLGRYTSAADHHRQALALLRQLGNRQGEAHALDNLGIVHIRLGQPAQATEHFQRALALFREIGNRDGEAWALNGLGEAAHAAGHPADALALHRDALGIATEIDTRDAQARAHTGLGRAHHALGDLTRARTHYERAIALYTDLDMPDAHDVRTHLAACDDAARPADANRETAAG
jgi:tetratricopeptide (TPR) repeat protein